MPKWPLLESIFIGNHAGDMHINLKSHLF